MDGLASAPLPSETGMRDQVDRDIDGLSPYEFLSPWIIYGPLVIVWILLGLRYRDFAVATLANPHIPAGGLCGESKGDILDQVGRDARAWIAPWHVFTSGNGSDIRAREAMDRLGLTFPVVVKPDIGCKGAGVRRLDGPESLRETLGLYPDNVAVMIQHFIPHVGEAGIFYSRIPGEATGRILSMTFKTSPSVVGDGLSTLRELVLAHPRTGRVPHVYLPRLAAQLDHVPEAGRRIPLVFTGNHSKGSAFRDASHLVTPELTRRIDAILRSMPDFHHGRVDLRFASVAALREGHGFQIIEINGIGSEPIHMWAPGTALADIYRIQFRFYGRAFRIGDLMRRRGHRSSGAFHMLRLWRRQSALIASYPPGH
ncbi:D-alanine--D-alanine ligase [Gluconacetobacter tumulisoli]|nr:D-alanine--D-alanine ligase [Gluconacetobacter tumulisoli]